ncbi:MAG: DUF367 domain-containing protein [Planctomycetota bacterium]|nr:MAG: DUF367 domain-containing protein [Planctomycetota bacterium]
MAHPGHLPFCSTQVKTEVILVRLNKESPRKCSLTPLRRQAEWGFRWLHVALGQEVEIGEATLLHPDGPVLTPADAHRPLMLVDSSWRDLPRVLRGLRGEFHYRSLPADLRTAYPRKSNYFPDPSQGLASIEALHAALAMLGEREDRLLEAYRWRQQYLDLNQHLLPA